MGRTVAVIGASSQRHKFGNKAFRALLRQGYTVFAVNPHEPEVEGHPTFPTVLDVPEPIEMATVYVQPEQGVQVMEQLAAKGVPEIWLNPGADGPAVVARARELGLHVIRACGLMGIPDEPGTGRRG